MTITDTIKEMFSDETGGGEASLHGLFVETLKDIYHAEKQILKALPKMARNATSPDLRDAFEKHRQQTQGQVERLEQVFELLEMSPRGKTCEAIQGLIAEAEEVMGEAEGAVLDAGLVAAAQAVEHYEMARYGTLVAWATQMGHTQAAKLLEQTLKEETHTDEALTKLAEKSINREAADAYGENAMGTRRSTGRGKASASRAHS
jgi:ferritin-like metal-binding protein YciE